MSLKEPICYRTVLQICSLVIGLVLDCLQSVSLVRSLLAGRKISYDENGEKDWDEMRRTVNYSTHPTKKGGLQAV